MQVAAHRRPCGAEHRVRQTQTDEGDVNHGEQQIGHSQLLVCFMFAAIKSRKYSAILSKVTYQTVFCTLRYRPTFLHYRAYTKSGSPP